MAVGVVSRREIILLIKYKRVWEDRDTHLRRASSYCTNDTDDVEYYLEFCGESVDVYIIQ